MRITRFILVALVATCHFATAQTHTGSINPGQPALEGMTTWAVSVDHPKLAPGFAEIDRAGMFHPWDDPAPAQRLEMVYGVVGYWLPTNTPVSFGIFAHPLYEDSAPEDFENFGAHFDNPIPLDPALAPPSEVHWSHMREREQFQFIRGADPYDPLAWDPANQAGAISFGGIERTTFFPIGTAAPKPMAEIFRAITRIPPESSSGGRFTGLNIVIQASAYDTNGPGMPGRVRLTNAIGLRCMIGPVIKLESNGRNHGPSIGDVVFRGDNVTPSIRAIVPNEDGTTTTQNVNLIDGSSFRIRHLADADSGVVNFRSATGVALTNSEEIFIRTFGPVQPILPSIPPILFNRTLPGNVLEHGFTVSGTATQIGELINLIPPINLLVGYDLEIAIHPYQQLSDRAGFGQNVDIDAVLSVDIAPPDDDPIVVVIPPDVAPALQPIGTTGVVKRYCWADLTADAEIEFVAGMATPNQQYFATIKLRETTP